MNKAFYLFTAVCLCAASCAEGPASTDNVVANPSYTTAADTNATKGLVDPVRPSMDFASVINYAIDNDTLSMWGTLCKYSKWAKELHNGNYTLLCPPNRVLQAKGKELMAALKDPANAQVLDALVAKHILSQPLDAKDQASATFTYTIDGVKTPMDLTAISGVKYEQQIIHTQHGSAVVIEDVIDFPKEELEKLAAKNQK